MIIETNMRSFILIILNFILVNGSLTEKRLYEDLMRGYNRLVRPVKQNSDKLIVKFGIRLTQILDVDEKNQILTTNVWLQHEWKDINLMWDPAEYEFLRFISIPSAQLWVPDIILYNSADGKYEVTLMTRANISFDGTVFWEPPAIYKSSCTINVEFFPFDQQHCTMKVDLIHESQDLDEEGEPIRNYINIGMDLKDFYQSHEWDVMAVPAKRNEIKSVSSKEFYPDITFNITLRRKTLFYSCTLIIPCVGITFLTVLTFYLPSESGEKISLCISILLSLTVFVLLLNDLIPPTSLVVPLIGKYLLFTIILVTLSILVTVVVLNIHFRSPSTHIMPKWARRLFLDVFPKILLMNRPQINSSLSDVFNVKELARLYLKKKRIDVDENELGKNQILNKHESSELIQKTNCQIVYKSKKEFLYELDRKEATRAVTDMVEQLRLGDEEKMAKEEWKYIALVIDRFFLVVFTTACIVGTLSIILQAPSFYDKQIPIDQLMSKHFKNIP